MAREKIWILALAAAAGCCASAQAGLMGDPLTIHAVSADGKTADWSLTSAAGTWQAENWNWKLGTTIDLRSSDGQLLAQVSKLEVGYIADPVISLGFLVTAGATDTTFTITSAQMTFSTINGAIARASGAITSTDLDGNGGFQTGLYAGVKSYTAHLNGPVGGAGTDFGVLVNATKMGSYESTTTSEAKPAVGYLAAGNVSSMQSAFSFKVSANDEASGTSVFVVVPTPGAGLLAGLGTLVAMRRRR